MAWHTCQTPGPRLQGLSSPAWCKACWEQAPGKPSCPTVAFLPTARPCASGDSLAGGASSVPGPARSVSPALEAGLSALQAPLSHLGKGIQTPHNKTLAPAPNGNHNIELQHLPSVRHKVQHLHCLREVILALHTTEHVQ